MKKDLVVAFIAALAIAAVTFALARMRPDFAPTPSHPYSTKTGKVAKAGPKAKTGKVVMRINGEPVTEGEFNAFAQSAPAEQRAFLSGSPEGRRLLANEIVKLKALEQEAARLGVANDPDVRSQVEMANVQIMAGHALEKLVTGKVDQYVNAEYQKEKEKAITLKHIVIAYAGGQLAARNGNAPPADQATRKAADIAARLRGGANFASIARAESDDQQTAMNGGVLGATRREMLPQMLPPDVAAVVGNLKSGQVSDPVRTPYGIHIFRVDEPSLEEMRPSLLREAQQRAMTETMNDLQKQAKVDLDPSFFPPSRGGQPATRPKG